MAKPINHGANALRHATKVVAHLKSGDHRSAMTHIGHALLATRAAMKGQASGAMGAMPDESEPQDNAAEEASEGMAPTPPAPSQSFFGQVGVPKKVKAPAMPSTASALPVKGGFNRSRFAAMKK